MQGTSLARPIELGFAERVLVPSLRNFLNRLGSLTPRRNVDLMARRLETAGRPFGLTVLNFLGVKFISALLFAALGALLFVFVLKQPPMIGVIFLFIFAILGLLSARVVALVQLFAPARARSCALCPMHST